MYWHVLRATPGKSAAWSFAKVGHMVVVGQCMQQFSKHIPRHDRHATDLLLSIACKQVDQHAS